MGDSSRAERSPLLGNGTDNEEAGVDEPRKPSGADTTRAQFLRVVIPGSLIVACFGFAAQFLSIGLSEMMEGSICQREYGNVTRPYEDPRCKNEAVQTRLATVKGWEQTFSLLPGLLLAVPYGIVADRYGPKLVLCLIWIGDILAQIGESAVCKPALPAPLLARSLTYQVSTRTSSIWPGFTHFRCFLQLEAALLDMRPCHISSREVSRV